MFIEYHQGFQIEVDVIFPEGVKVNGINIGTGVVVSEVDCLGSLIH